MNRLSLGLSAAICLATSLRAAESVPVIDTTPPVITGTPVLTPNPNPAVPLVATITYTTNEPTQTFLTVNDGTTIRSFVADPSYVTFHRVAVLGCKPNRTHTIRVTARDQGGNAASAPNALTFVTPQLPADFPPMVNSVSLPTRMEPGLTLFQATYTTPGNPNGPTGSYIVMIDNKGEPVWFFRPVTQNVGLATMMRNGNLLYLTGGFVAGSQAVEIDLYGTEKTRWAATGLGTSPPPGSIHVATDSFHHEIRELRPSDEADFVALSFEMRTYPNYPANEVDPTITDASANVVGDVIIEFKRDGTIVRETKLLDVLDPYRVCYGSLATLYNTVYPGFATKDWSHGNSVVVDYTDNTYIYSARHQDAVVKIRRDTGQIVWICGSHDRWQAPWSNYLLTPVGDGFEWNFHQHDPEIGFQNRIVIFDNGNYRVIPPNAPAPTSTWYSRAVEYAINPTAMTVEQTWVYGGPGSTQFYSGFLGGSKPMPRTGNVLVTDGAKAQGPTTAARIVEVAHNVNPGLPVFETTIKDPTSTVNWTVYRSERIPGIYPVAWGNLIQH